MKKTVFLLLIFTLFMTSLEVKGLNDGVYEFSDYELHIKRVRNEYDISGYNIVKLGSNTFEVDFFIEGYIFYINNVKEVDGNHVIYGYAHMENADTYYDPFLLVLDKEGTVIFSCVEDLGNLEAVYDVVKIDNLILVHFVRSEAVYQDIEFKDNIFVSYDLNYNEINRLITTSKIKSSINTENLYLFSLDSDEDFEGAITSDLDMITETDELFIATDEVYFEDVQILFINDALLNGERVFNGVYIDYPGFYELVYNDYEYTFTVIPLITGIDNLGVYGSPVTPNVTNGSIYLNNEIFTSGTEISEPGNYRLKVEGANGYSKEVVFTITSHIDGVLHNQTYSDEVEISFNGVGFLNNTFIESPYIISDDGEYILKIQGQGNYLETYYFNITKDEEKSTFIDFAQKYDVVFLAVVVIGGGIILKKK